VPLTQHKQQQVIQHRKANMPKTKSNIKVRDLKPSKDAKGGGGHGTQRRHGRRHSIQGGGSATQGGGSATQGGGSATQGGGYSQG
jgi:hypothetical protein